MDSIILLYMLYTSLGETYAMMGPRDNPQINVRSLKELNSKEKTEFTMKVTNILYTIFTIWSVYGMNYMYTGINCWSVQWVTVWPTDLPITVQNKLTIQKKGKDLHVPVSAYMTVWYIVHVDMCTVRVNRDTCTSDWCAKDSDSGEKQSNYSIN